MRVLYPDSDVSTLSSADANEGGVVMQLTYGSSTMLLMADVPQAVERHLVEIEGGSTAGGLDSDILKVGHHGSRTSTSHGFVSAVSPGIAVISVGSENRYGHPTQDVLNVLERHGVLILRTDIDGTIKFQSKGGEFVRVK